MDFNSSDTTSQVVLAISLAWSIFVIAFMAMVWHHLAALRERLAPAQNPLSWDRTGTRYGVAVPLQQPMYAIYERGGRSWPVEVFPFTMDGRETARARWQELEKSASA